MNYAPTRERSLPQFLGVPIAMGLAMAVTLGLFWMMQYLIAMGTGPATEQTKAPAIEFTRLLKDSDIAEPKPKKLTPPKDLAPPPPPPTVPQHAKKLDGAGPLTANFEAEGIELDGGKALAAGQDKDVTPLVRVEPVYPRRALARGIEGWVEVTFTITKFGSVRNPVVTAADPTGVFDRAALKAVQKWKYQPKIEDGVAVDRHGVAVVLSFTLDR